LKAIRLLRVVKLVRNWSALQDIIKKTIMSISDISNFSVLLFLFMYIAALLGIELFANYVQFNENKELLTDVILSQASGVDMKPPRENFDNIGNALTTVFILIIGEDWPGIMYNFSRIYGDKGGFVCLYFVSVLVVGNLMLLSLFTAILL
jgi:hypothetical protein